MKSTNPNTPEAIITEATELLGRLICDLVTQAQSDYSRTLAPEAKYTDEGTLSDQSYETIEEFVKGAAEGTIRDELVSAIIDVTIDRMAAS